MIIPDKIRIGGQDISVVNKERLDDNNLGTICVAEGVLQIFTLNPALASASKRESLPNTAESSS